jgi:hypothetical protein
MEDEIHKTYNCIYEKSPLVVIHFTGKNFAWFSEITTIPTKNYLNKPNRDVV